MISVELPVNYHEIPHWERWKVREEYSRIQQGRCYYCEAPLDGPPAKEIADKAVTSALFPKNFFAHPVHLHHDHTTGLTIGAVHCYCNAVLWEYEGE